MAPPPRRGRLRLRCRQPRPDRTRQARLPADGALDRRPRRHRRPRRPPTVVFRLTGPLDPAACPTLHGAPADRGHRRPAASSIARAAIARAGALERRLEKQRPAHGRPPSSPDRTRRASRHTGPPPMDTHPQLLDHRPHRPRQVDPGRPHAGDHRRHRPEEDARPGARLDGPRARARDHDQGAGGAGRVPGRRRAGLPPAPDRHPRPRRLLLRGLAQPRRLRGRAARRRRRPGGRGADGRQHLPGDRERPRADPGDQQGRPARGRAGPGRGRRSPTCSAATPTTR